jgi:hypothetical protein
MLLLIRRVVRFRPGGSLATPETPRGDRRRPLAQTSPVGGQFTTVDAVAVAVLAVSVSV